MIHYAIKFRNIILLVVISGIIVLLTSSIASAARGGNTDATCRYGVRMVDNGTLPSGNKYISFEYYLLGNDYARRFQDPAIGNSVSTENGSVISSASSCTQVNSFWNGNSVNINSTNYRNFYSSTFSGVPHTPVNIFLGIPDGGNYASSGLAWYCGAGIGSGDPNNGGNSQRRQLGIWPYRDGGPDFACDVNNEQTFATINDGGLATKGSGAGNVIWCTGMNFGIFSGTPECNGIDSATVYQYGGDFAGYLKRDVVNARAGLDSSIRTSVQNFTNINSFMAINPAANDYSYELTLLAQNTRDPIPPFAPFPSNCANVPPNTPPCVVPGLPNDPFLNQKSSIIFTYELESDVVAPTCSAPRITTRAGEPFRLSINVSNGDANAVAVNSIDYNINTVPTVTNGSISSPANVPANGDRTYDSVNETIGRPGTYTVSWTVATPNGTAACSSEVEVTILPPTCTVSPISSDINTPFNVLVVINNPNLVRVAINSTSWSMPGGTPSSGVGVLADNGDPINSTGGGAIVSVGGSITVYSEDVTISTTGDYQVDWSVETGAGNIACDSSTSNTDTSIRTIPYVRFYGNDVVAGGGYGSSCTPVGSPTARANGAFNPVTPKNHSTYVGSASELAIFAADQITKVLPGSQLASRSTLWELSFANDNTLSNSVNSLEFGGGFANNNQLCTDDTPLAVGFDDSTSLTDISALDGDFYSSSNVIINASSIGNGQRIRIVSGGNVTITGDLVYSSTDWPIIEDIPLLRIYATGDIYVDSSVENLDGLYSAEGNIYTCTSGSTVLEANSDDAAIISNCSKKLTVTGAFVSAQTHLTRINGTLSTGAPIETWDSGNIAESFVFSPEMYMAILDEGSNTDVGKFDSLLSLPPAF